MRLLSSAWRIAVNLVSLFVILAMFRVASSPFETIVISGLTLIYGSVTSALALLARLLVEGNLARARQFIKIAQLLNDRETEDYKELLKEQSDELQKAQLGFWINALFGVVMYFVAIWKLLAAVGIL